MQYFSGETPGNSHWEDGEKERGDRDNVNIYLGTSVHCEEDWI
jgi:hypothetical protein